MIMGKRKDAKRTELDLAWDVFRRDPADKTLRNRLVEAYLPIVRYQAEKLCHATPQMVDVDDLKSAGVFGLIDAIASFDPARGVRFETYSPLRIRGAMLDWIREMDWVPRLVRTHASKLAAAKTKLRLTTGRSPTVEELAKELSISVGEVEVLQAEANTVGVESMERIRLRNAEGKDVTSVEWEWDRRGEDPTLDSQRADLLKLVTKGLKQNERLIIILYYFEEMTMKEIGATLDLSESRVSQMHSAILARLKTLLGARRPEFAIAAARPR